MASVCDKSAKSSAWSVSSSVVHSFHLSPLLFSAIQVVLITQLMTIIKCKMTYISLSYFLFYNETGVSLRVDDTIEVCIKLFHEWHNSIGIVCPQIRQILKISGRLSLCKLSKAFFRNQQNLQEVFSAIHGTVLRCFVGQIYGLCTSTFSDTSLFLSQFLINTFYIS